METLTVIRQTFGEESMSRTWAFEWYAWIKADRKRRQVRSKVKSMLIIFFNIKEIVHKEFFLVGQTVNSAYYCDLLWRMCEDVKTSPRTLATKEMAVASWQRTISHFLFTREFLTKN
jgi:hypothetical protein